jgi:hypothetical protein
MEIAGKIVPAKNYLFYCDASHNDGRGMMAGGLNFNFVSWEGAGFQNYPLEDFEATLERGNKKTKLIGKRGKVFHRKPMFHSAIMKLIENGKLISVANAGTSVYRITRDEFLSRFDNNK